MLLNLTQYSSSGLGLSKIYTPSRVTVGSPHEKITNLVFMKHEDNYNLFATTDQNLYSAVISKGLTFVSN
jgi:hypothetical protein